jgi:hypothetical protein
MSRKKTLKHGGTEEAEGMPVKHFETRAHFGTCNSKGAPYARITTSNFLRFLLSSVFQGFVQGTRVEISEKM